MAKLNQQPYLKLYAFAEQKERTARNWILALTDGPAR